MWKRSLLYFLISVLFLAACQQTLTPAPTPTAVPEGWIWPTETAARVGNHRTGYDRNAQPNPYRPTFEPAAFRALCFPV